MQLPGLARTCSGRRIRRRRLHDSSPVGHGCPASLRARFVDQHLYPSDPGLGLVAASQVEREWARLKGEVASPSDELWDQLDFVASADGEVVRVVVPIFRRGASRAEVGVAMRVDHVYGLAWLATIEGFREVATDLPLGSERSQGPTGDAVDLGEEWWTADGDPVPESWRPGLEVIVRRLVAGEVDGLVADELMHGDGRSVSIREAIEGYVEPIVEMPERGWEHADFSESGGDGVSWLNISLWTARGPSQLTLEATVYETDSNVRVVVDNVHVL